MSTSLPELSSHKPPARRSHHIGVWPVVVSAVAVAAGAFVGQLWLPLGLFASATIGVCLAGLVEGIIGVLGTAVGIPVLRSVGSTIIHSPLYLPAALLGMGFGAAIRFWLKRGST